MEHKALFEIDQVAERIASSDVFKPMSRQERLERWAFLLEGLRDKPLKALMRVEFLPEHERAVVRADDSPLSVAYGDPALRAAGLQSDRYGDGMNFFELSNRQAHYLLCDCHYHGSMTASTVAARVRATTPTGARAVVGELLSRICGG